MLILIGGLIIAYFIYILLRTKNDKSFTDPVIAHAALREIVERAMKEAQKLPELNTSMNATHLREGCIIADHSYEDLLATAILNKVVDKFQSVDSNSNILCDTFSTAKHIMKKSEHNHKEDVENYISDHIEYKDDCNEINNANNCESTSFMMEKRIEKVTMITSDNEELSDDNEHNYSEFQYTQRVPFLEFGTDIIDVISGKDIQKLPSSLSSSSLDFSDLNLNKHSSIKKRRHLSHDSHMVELVSPLESWEDNWLFQKKRISWSQPDAIVMLIPNSNTCYKPLIGDRNAEDTSDLSECSSTKSDEESEKELIEAINNVVSSMPNYKEGNNQEYSIVMQSEKDDICNETKLNIEKNAAICKNFNKTNNKKYLEIFEKKKIKNDYNIKEEQSGSSSFITLTKGINKMTREIKEDDYGQWIIATAMRNSMQEDITVGFKKSDKENDKEKKDTFSYENEEQRDSEYTEHYDTVIQKRLDDLTKIEICTGKSKTVKKITDITNKQFRESDNFQKMFEKSKSEYSKDKPPLPYGVNNNKDVDVKNENNRLSAPPRPGTIAEREHKKWENAPPIENNPYSEENIRKRCLERQYSKNLDIPKAHYELKKLSEANLETNLAVDRPDIKRFGRDYYINQSKTSSGERHGWNRSAISNRVNTSLSQQLNYIGDMQ
ncbi:hypothetical protein HN011_006770 [Eciton burchellii]|nr:hypothetical protein HN011_006770 [Eciton burchellii]